MLDEEVRALQNVQDWDELNAVFVRFAYCRDFDFVGGLAVVDRIGQPSEFFGTHNVTGAYSDIAADPERNRRCPVMQHCKRSSIPLAWDQATYVASGNGALWEEQAAFGYRTGVITGLHLPKGRHYAFGVDRPQSLPRGPKELTRLIADVQLFAVYAGEAMAKILNKAGVGRAPRLGPRELECLRWTMEGKTAWEVAQILNVAERTVVFYLSNAARKLGCTSKHQAVARAMQLGLLG